MSSVRFRLALPSYDFRGQRCRARRIDAEVILALFVGCCVLAVGCGPVELEPLSAEWVEFEAGEFTMGSDSSGISRESPAHVVSVRRFAILTQEVMAEEYYDCMEAGACTPPAEGEFCINPADQVDYAFFPVNCVDWDQASSYCKWLGGRLPTEAEWEYAARSGGLDNEYPWGDDAPTCDHGVFLFEGSDLLASCDPWGPFEVCSKRAGNTQQNLYDMAGNVAEWVGDVWHDDYDGAPDTSSAWTRDGDRDERVVRGGSWNQYPHKARTRARARYARNLRASIIGFRCAMSR